MTDLAPAMRENKSFQSGPQADAQAAFEASDSDGFDPGAAVEDLRDERVVDSTVAGRSAQAPVANGGPQVDCDATQDLGVWVGACNVRPVTTEGARGISSRAGHVPSLGDAAIDVANQKCQDLEVTSTLTSGDNYSQQDEERALMVKKIDSFVPKVDPADWVVIEEFVRDIVRDAEPDRYTTAQPWLSAVAQLVQWSVKVECLNLDREVILAPANIFDFVGQRTYATDASQGTIRSILLRISARVVGEHAGATEDRRSYNASQGKKPYSSSEKRGLRSFVNGQATEHRRVNLAIVVAVAAGAGVTAVEMLRMKPEHVEVSDDMVLVRVPGKQARTVPVLAEWDDYARVALESARAGGWLLLPNYDKYRVGNAVADFLWTCNGVGVKPHCQRLRSTWIIDHLNAGTHVNLLLEAAGVSNVSTLQRYLQFVQARPMASNLDALRLGGRHV